MTMSTEEIEAKASELRHRAKKNLNAMFRIPEGYSSGTVEQIVDDVISCAVLEIAAIQAKATTPKS